MKKEQLKIAEVLYELGMSYDIIEKITSIAPSEVRYEMSSKNKRKQKEPYKEKEKQQNHD